MTQNPDRFMLEVIWDAMLSLSHTHTHLRMDASSPYFPQLILFSSRIVNFPPCSLILMNWFNMWQTDKHRLAVLFVKSFKLLPVSSYQGASSHDGVTYVSSWLDGTGSPAYRSTSLRSWAAPYGGFTPDMWAERRMRDERDLQDALMSKRDSQSNRFAEFE